MEANQFRGNAPSTLGSNSPQGKTEGHGYEQTLGP